MRARWSAILVVMVLALAIVAGCATWPATNGGTASGGDLASPASPAPPVPAPPSNVFGPEPSHYFGTGGP